MTVHSGDGHGHGFLVRQGATCYVILPKHVAAGRRNVTVFSAAPVVHSSALIETPFWDGMDLAIGIVRGAVEQRCLREVSDLKTSVQPENAGRVQLLRLRQSGEPERVDMIITDSQYLTLDAEITDGQSELFKGTSGSFLFAGDTPIGMVVEALSPTKGRFVRIEEIFQNVHRRVDRRSGYAAAIAPPQPPAVTEADGGLPFDLVSASLPPVSPELSESNLNGPGSYVFELTRPNRLAFKAKGGAVALSKVQIRAEAEAGYGIPRTVLIELSNTEDGVRTRMPTSVEMAPDGLLDLALQQTTRWVFITIGSGWDSATIGLDSVTFR
ncbi:MAG: hypothetical protein ACK4HF_04545 [Paracoccaceae bacterium]